jgi:hypothetical protein
MTVDIGSPIDRLIADKLRECSADEIEAACATVDPDSGRYWLFLKDTIYVLSYFEGAQVSAWSTYLPQTEDTDAITAMGYPNGDVEATTGDHVFYVTIGRVYTWNRGSSFGTLVCGSVTLTESGTFIAEDDEVVVTTTQQSHPVSSLTEYGLVSFVPYRFEVFKGKVYARSSDAVILYGGTDGNTYDRAICSWETPWLNNKQPATRKMSRSINVVYSGKWNIYVGLDFLSGTQDFVLQTDDDDLGTHENGVVPFVSQGTHFKFKGQTVDQNAATFSSFILHFQEGDKR